MKGNMTDPLSLLLGAWCEEPSLASILFRVVLAMLFATVIGCERSTKRHAAGLRTFILVSLAGAAASMLDVYVFNAEVTGAPVLSAAATVSVAIISGNSILYSSKNQIKGLTTAVALWASGILGLAVGAGFYTAATIGFAAVLCSLSLFPRFERYLKNRSNHFEMHIELTDKSELRPFVSTLRELGLKVDDIELNPAYLSSGLSVYSVSVTVRGGDSEMAKRSHADIVNALRSLEYVYYAEQID